MCSDKSVYTCTRNNGQGLLVNILIAVFLAKRAPLRPSSPAGWPSGFNLFLFCTSWNHFGFKISDKNRRETTKTIQKNHWNQVTKKKDTVSI